METRQLKCVREHLKRRQTALAGTQAHAGTHKLHTGTHKHMDTQTLILATLKAHTNRKTG